MDPFKWIYWDIPTHSELSLWDLQKRAILQQMEVDSVNAKTGREPSKQLPGRSDTSDVIKRAEATAETFTFRVIENSLPGKLSLTRDEISFRQRRKTVWTIAYNDLVEMSKGLARSGTKVMSLGQARHQIIFVFSNDEGVHVERKIEVDQADRDEIFSIVIGWSGRYWKPMRARGRYKGPKL